MYFHKCSFNYKDIKFRYLAIILNDRLSVGYGGNVNFSVAIEERGRIFLVTIPLIFEHLFSKNILSVGLLVRHKCIHTLCIERFWHFLFIILWSLNICSITHYVRLSIHDICFLHFSFYYFLFPFPYIFQILWNSFATYVCCHTCFLCLLFYDHCISAL